MREPRPQSGFTLVELAIVIVIAGILIGGALKGQELVMNSRATATISQVRGFESAVYTFRKKYNSGPGDTVGASAHIPRCPAACNPSVAKGNDSIVGLTNWGAGGWLSQSGNAPALITTDERGETVLFWVHLLFADLISGVDDSALSGGVATWGKTHPSAKIGGGFIVGYGDGTVLPGAPAGGKGPLGLLIGLVKDPTTGGVAAMTAAGQQLLTPTRAAQIDRKMDDGLPDTGYVQTYGVTGTCSGNAAPYAYQETISSYDCGLFFRIQG